METGRAMTEGMPEEPTIPDRRSRPRGRFGWLTTAVLLALLLACSGRDRPVNVAVFLVDTLRADRLGAYGYARPTSPAIEAEGSPQTRGERPRRSRQGATAPAVSKP